jgi:hypothetical protein
MFYWFLFYIAFTFDFGIVVLGTVPYFMNYGYNVNKAFKSPAVVLAIRLYQC